MRGSRIRTMIFFAVLISSPGCRSREPEATQVASAVEEDEGMRTLFRCKPEAGIKGMDGRNLKIVADAEDQAVPPQNIFIAIGDGVRVRSVCGERKDLGLKSVFACWYSGGGLTIYWPGKTPESEDLVQVDRKRIFGAIDLSMNRLQCTRQASLEILRVEEPL